MISSGTYPAGGRLPPERELAEQFSVSRPTIREAIIALEAKGLVRIKSGSGVYVLSPNAGGNLVPGHGEIAKEVHLNSQKHERPSKVRRQP